MSRTITTGAKDILHAGYNNRNQNVCAVCLSIPFDKLPAEDEAAYPHHPSLATLEASARSCPLCTLILQSMNEEKQSLKDEQLRSGILMGNFADLGPHLEESCECVRRISIGGRNSGAIPEEKR